METRKIKENHVSARRKYMQKRPEKRKIVCVSGALRNREIRTSKKDSEPSKTVSERPKIIKNHEKS